MESFVQDEVGGRDGSKIMSGRHIRWYFSPLCIPDNKLEDIT